MARHKVVMKIPPKEIKRADVSFTVHRDGETFGTLEISNGSIVWFPAGTSNGCRMRWERFDELMEKYAAGVEKR